MERKKALIVMQRKVLSDALVEYTKSEAQLDITVEHSYAMAALTAEALAPNVMMMEIPESGPWKSAEKCLAVCDVIKKQASNCKLIILCSEGDLNSCRTVIAAKRESRIDDFLYYETSIEYLFSKLASFAG